MYDPEDTPNLSFCNEFLLVPVFLWKEKSYKVEASASRGPVGCATRGDEGLQLPSAISKQVPEDHELGCGSGTSRKEVGNHRILQSNLALVLETGPVALHKVKEGHGSIWTTFKSCIKVISVGSVMCFSSSSYCFSSSHFFDHGWILTWHRWQKMDGGHNVYVFTIKTYWKRVRSQYQPFSERDYEFSSGTRDQEHHGKDRVCYGGLKFVRKL